MTSLEHEAKTLLARAGLAVPRGGVAFTPAQAGAIATELGGAAVVKAQVPFGGRGRAGGVVVAESPDDAEKACARLLTGFGGSAVRAVLVEERIAVERESYLAVTVDGGVGGAVLMFAPRGGVDVEETVTSDPGGFGGSSGESGILTLPLVPVDRVREHQVRSFLWGAGLGGKVLAEVARFGWGLYRLMLEFDLTLLEINPLGLTPDGRAIALDAKVVADDAAAYRRPAWTARECEPADPWELEARKLGLRYVRLDGNVGIVASGAGLGMCTMDLVRDRGLKPANFLETGGGITRQLMAGAVRLVAGQPGVRGIIANVYGGVNSLVAAAEGVVDVLGSLPGDVPVVVKALGNEQEAAWAMLRACGAHVVESVHTEAAVDCLADLMGG
ncbi:MAG: ATP-grasp domain-containing protein [Bacillota bacterium]